MCVRVHQQAGIYWVTLIDQFVASWVLLFLTLFEIIGICYIYGTSDFLEMLAARAAAMTGSCLCRRQPVHWRHWNDAGTEELHVLAVVESLLVLHQSVHHSGEYDANNMCDVSRVLWRQIDIYYGRVIELHLNVGSLKVAQHSKADLCHRWSWSGLWWPSRLLPMEECRSQAGAWLWAGAW